MAHMRSQSQPPPAGLLEYEPVCRHACMVLNLLLCTLNRYTFNSDSDSANRTFVNIKEREGAPSVNLAMTHSGRVQTSLRTRGASDCLERRAQGYWLRLCPHATVVGVAGFIIAPFTASIANQAVAFRCNFVMADFLLYIRLGVLHVTIWIGH